MNNMILISRKETQVERFIVTLSLACLGILNASMAWVGVPWENRKQQLPFHVFFFCAVGFRGGAAMRPWPLMSTSHSK